MRIWKFFIPLIKNLCLHNEFIFQKKKLMHFPYHFAFLTEYQPSQKLVYRKWQQPTTVSNSFWTFYVHLLQPQLELIFIDPPENKTKNLIFTHLLRESMDYLWPDMIINQAINALIYLNVRFLFPSMLYTIRKAQTSSLWQLLRRL